MSILKNILIAAITFFALSGIAEASCPIKNTNQIILYKSAWSPGNGNPAQKWLAYDAAYTAQTFSMPFDALKAGNAQICSAVLTVVWAANSTNAYTGTGMFACPSLSKAPNVDLMGSCSWARYFAGSNTEWANYTPGCAALTDGTGPRPCRVDVTDAFNNMISAGIPYYLTIGTFGNGINGPLIYNVELSISWQ